MITRGSVAESRAALRAVFRRKMLRTLDSLAARDRLKGVPKKTQGVYGSFDLQREWTFFFTRRRNQRGEPAANALARKGGGRELSIERSEIDKEG